MLRSFRDKDTEAIWCRQRSRRLDGPTERVAWRKLALLDAAETLTDLLIPPGHRLEKLTGDRGGQYSIRGEPPVADLLSLVGRWTRGRRDR